MFDDVFVYPEGGGGDVGGEDGGLEREEGGEVVAFGGGGGVGCEGQGVRGGKTPGDGGLAGGGVSVCRCEGGERGIGLTVALLGVIWKCLRDGCGWPELRGGWLQRLLISTWRSREGVLRRL